VIEDGAFIGSDTQLIAPVRVGKRAVVGAGTTVTRDVPAGALALARVEQIDKPGYADKVAKRNAAPKNGAGKAAAPARAKAKKAVKPAAKTKVAAARKVGSKAGKSGRR